MSQLVLLALGSNQGNRQQNLIHAIDALKAEMHDWLATSPFYETEPVGVQHTTPYINGVVAFSSSLSPFEILAITEAIEKAAGRQHKGDLQPRLLDVDILAVGNTMVETLRLHLPHPRMAERRFVLEPLAQLVPGWKHPVTGLFPAQMLARLGNGTGWIRPFI